MKLELSKKISEFLSLHPEERFTAREIAQWVLETYPMECEAKRERSKAIINPLEDNNSLVQQIVAEIASQRQSLQRQNPQIKVTEERPRKYYFTTQSDQAAVEEAEAQSLEQNCSMPSYIKYSEHDLYPMLSAFLESEFSMYSKRINEKRSSNSRGVNGNKWLYPDLVAMEDLTVNWDISIKDCVKHCADKKAKLWSFEVKLLINRSNVREAFFQTVSNSSWANYGYLTATELSGEDTYEELRILSALHGIGFILFDINSPNESRVLLPARERIDIDWNIANRLSKENQDFKAFVEEVTSFYQTGKTKKSDWQSVYD